MVMIDSTTVYIHAMQFSTVKVFWKRNAFQWTPKSPKGKNQVNIPHIPHIYHICSMKPTAGKGKALVVANKVNPSIANSSEDVVETKKVKPTHPMTRSTLKSVTKQIPNAKSGSLVNISRKPTDSTSKAAESSTGRNPSLRSTRQRKARANETISV